MTKQELISTLNTGVSEFAFIPVSKVIELVNSLEETTPSTEGLDEAVGNVLKIVRECVEDVTWSDYVDTDNVRLSLSGNEIYVDEVEFNSYEFTRDFMRNIMGCLDELNNNKED
jgi:hypothetical protein